MKEQVFPFPLGNPSDKLGIFYHSMANMKFDQLKYDNEFREKLRAKSKKYLSDSINIHELYREYLPYYHYSTIIAKTYLGIIFRGESVALRRSISSGGPTEMELTESTSIYSKIAELERKSKDYLAGAIESIADDLELNLISHSIKHDIYLREENLIPRLRMNEIANNRYRQILRFDGHRDEVLSSIAISQTQIRPINRKSVMKICEDLRKYAKLKGTGPAILRKLQHKIRDLNYFALN